MTELDARVSEYILSAGAMDPTMDRILLVVTLASWSADSTIQYLQSSP